MSPESTGQKLVTEKLDNFCSSPQESGCFSYGSAFYLLQGTPYCRSFWDYGLGSNNRHRDMCIVSGCYLFLGQSLSYSLAPPGLPAQLQRLEDLPGRRPTKAPSTLPKAEHPKTESFSAEQLENCCRTKIGSNRVSGRGKLEENSACGQPETRLEFYRQVL